MGRRCSARVVALSPRNVPWQVHPNASARGGVLRARPRRGEPGDGVGALGRWGVRATLVSAPPRVVIGQPRGEHRVVRVAAGEAEAGIGWERSGWVRRCSRAAFAPLSSCAVAASFPPGAPLGTKACSVSGTPGSLGPFWWDRDRGIGVLPRKRGGIHGGAARWKAPFAALSVAWRSKSFAWEECLSPSLVRGSSVSAAHRPGSSRIDDGGGVDRGSLLGRGRGRGGPQLKPCLSPGPSPEARLDRREPSPPC